MTTLHMKAIYRAEELIDKAEHNLCVLIALKRARNGNTARFPFKFRNQANERWLVARIKDQTAMRAGHTLEIDYYNSEVNYFACDVRHAEELKVSLSS